MRVAALDFGKVRVGAAVSDELGLLAHPRPCFSAKSLTQVIVQVSAWLQDEQAERVLVGVPESLHGGEGASARRARRFARLLEGAQPVPVELVDEALTTHEAARLLAARGLSVREARSKIDSAAAAVMLQDWLDARPKGERATPVNDEGLPPPSDEGA